MTELKTIAQNRKAYHDYHILETMEAGIVLMGTEIKSIRESRVTISDAYAKPENGELWLFNSHIAIYEAGSRSNHDPMRKRKLLLHHKQIDYLSSQADTKGLTIVPLKIYIKNGLAKVELGVAKGKREFDKRETITKRETDRIIQRSMKQRV